jgi:hypothetical protein
MRPRAANEAEPDAQQGKATDGQPDGKRHIADKSAVSGDG